MQSIFITCPKGLEELLKNELEDLGVSDSQLTVAGVAAKADLAQIYHICLWSRLANRVLLQLCDGPARTIAHRDDLYGAAFEIPWEQHFLPENSFLVDFVGTNEAINNSQFGAMCVKDAIVDRFTERLGGRPRVDRDSPDLRINVRLAKNRVSIALDLSGESLHRRGYRRGQGEAPLKENLAAAILLRAGWPALAAQDAPLVDPMCGSGTLLIEALWMAGDVAPALLRESFGFERWRGHEPALWAAIREQAMARREAGLAGSGVQVIGMDQDPNIVALAKRNLAAAGVGERAQVHCESVSRMSLDDDLRARRGLMICNPPYGQRLGEKEALRDDYQVLAAVSKSQCPGWRLAVFTANEELAQEMRLRSEKKYQMFNGALPSQLLIYELKSAEQARLRDDRVAESELSDGAVMVLNRLRKNQKKLRPWVQKNSIECYRLYDADLPEYAAAIDVYAGRVHVQEYVAPKSVDPVKAQTRWRELLQATAVALEVPLNQLVLKQRQKGRGGSAGEKPVAARRHEVFPVKEGAGVFYINLHDYLDTGLFLDHRPLRLRIAAESRDKDFLNLFCYTATASVHAVLGGARSSVSVDMSRTYLDWARRNFDANNIRSARHQLEQADCLRWLDSCRQRFDLIMLDPPTFSNSKRMDNVLDVQRDHVDLIDRCMELLNPGGVLYFSTNLRSFRLDAEILEDYAVEDITAQTIDKDFERNARIHRCYHLQHKEPAYKVNPYERSLSRKQ